MYVSKINLSYKLVQINSIAGQKATWLTWSAVGEGEKKRRIYKKVDVACWHFPLNALTEQHQTTSYISAH